MEAGCAAGRLPEHGRIACADCFGGTPVDFDLSRVGNGRWRITANPCAWGNPKAEVLMLGFSKGPTQAGGLARKPHDRIAYEGARGNVRRILHALGLVPADADMDRLIADRRGRFAFGSLIRCTVERQDPKTGGWEGTGGDMLGGFAADPWGRHVVRNCATRHLARLPASTRLVMLFGFGRDGAYVDEAERVIRSVRPTGAWRRVNEVAYTDGRVVFAHVEHFRAQGRLIPDWLGEPRGDGRPACPKRTRWRRGAEEAVRLAFPDGLGGAEKTAAADRAGVAVAVWVTKPDTRGAAGGTAARRVNVPVAADGTHFGPHLRHRGEFQVGDKGDERRFTDFSEALAYLKARPVARWRRPNAAGGRGIVAAVRWDDHDV